MKFSKTRKLNVLQFMKSLISLSGCDTYKSPPVPLDLFTQLVVKCTLFLYTTRMYTDFAFDFYKKKKKNTRPSSDSIGRLNSFRKTLPNFTYIRDVHRVCPFHLCTICV